VWSQVGELANLAFGSEVHVQKRPAVVHDAVEIWPLGQRAAQPLGEPLPEGIDAVYLRARRGGKREGGSQTATTSPRQPKAPTGSPPPIILPIVVRSGRTPKTSWKPPT